MNYVNLLTELENKLAAVGHPQKNNGKKESFLERNHKVMETTSPGDSSPGKTRIRSHRAVSDT